MGSEMRRIWSNRNEFTHESDRHNASLPPVLLLLLLLLHHHHHTTPHGMAGSSRPSDSSISFTGHTQLATSPSYQVNISGYSDLIHRTACMHARTHALATNPSSIVYTRQASSSRLPVVILHPRAPARPPTKKQ